MRLRLVVVLAAASALAACSAILGIDYPPLRADADADAGDGGLVSPLHCSLARLAQGSPCTAECPHAFCDDFEDGGPSFPPWSAPTGLANPVIYGDGGVAYVEPGSSGGTGLSCSVGASKKGTAGAVLIDAIPASAFGDPAQIDGERVAFDVQFRRLAIEAGGPIPDAGSGLVAAFGSVSKESNPPGPTLFVTDHRLYLGISSDIFAGGDTSAITPVTDDTIDVSRFVGSGTWSKMSIYAGSASRARALGYAACPDVPYVFAASSFPGQGVCIAAQDGYDVTALAKDASLILGTIIRATGDIELAYDNVYIDVYTRSDP